MTFWEIMLLLSAGFFVGFFNTLAGGATVVSIGVMMFLGLPASVANGTHRIAAAFQTATSVAYYGRKKVLDYPAGIRFGIPMTLGSIIGALIAVRLKDPAIERIIGLAMLLMLVFLFVNPKKWLEGNPDLRRKRAGAADYLLYFALGLYGGFIYIGIGYFLLATLVVRSGFDLVKANALKSFVVALYVPFSTLIYMWMGLVDYQFALVLTIGQMTGAWMGARASLKFGTNFVRWILALFIVLTCLQLFGILDIRGLFAGRRGLS
jgi:uncharacterized membrane protein YfcA